MIRGSRGLRLHLEGCHTTAEQRSITRETPALCAQDHFVFAIMSQTHFSLQPSQSGLLTAALFSTIKYVSLSLYEVTSCVACSLDAATLSLKSFMSCRQQHQAFVFYSGTHSALLSARSTVSLMTLMTTQHLCRAVGGTDDVDFLIKEAGFGHLSNQRINT